MSNKLIYFRFCYLRIRILNLSLRKKSATGTKHLISMSVPYPWFLKRIQLLLKRVEFETWRVVCFNKRYFKNWDFIQIAQHQQFVKHFGPTWEYKMLFYEPVGIRTLHVVGFFYSVFSFCSGPNEIIDTVSESRPS